MHRSRTSAVGCASTASGRVVKSSASAATTWYDGNANSHELTWVISAPATGDGKPTAATSVVSTNARTTSTATSGASRFRLIASTFASFQSRAPLAIHGSHASAARTPGTLFAAIAVPVPVQHITTP